MAEAAKALRFLDPAEVAALAAELRSEGDPQEHVGPAHALRAGVYRDFEHGFTWTKPAGFCGAATLATAHVRGSRRHALQADACSAEGWRGWSSLSGVWASRRAHSMRMLSRSSCLETRCHDPTVIHVLGATVLSTEVRSGFPEDPCIYLVASATRGSRAFKLVFWGLPGNVAAARPQVQAAIRGFAFFDELRALELGAADVVDRRLAYGLKRPPGAGWKFSQQTPPDTGEFGSILAYSRPGGLVHVGAFCGLDEEEDDSLLREIATQGMRSRAEQAGLELVEKPATVNGLPATRLELGVGDPIVAFYLRRGKTVYLLQVDAPAKLGIRSPTSWSCSRCSTSLDSLR